MTLPTPNAFAGALFFEDILRKFFAYQFVQISKLANDPVQSPIDDLFGRYGEDIRAQIKLWFTEHTNIVCVINWPKLDFATPFVGIVNASEQEAPQAYLGDYGGLVNSGAHSVQASSTLATKPDVYGQAILLPDNRPRATHVRKLLSIPENRTINIYIGTADPNSTIYVYTVVKMLLLRNKIDIDKYAGVRNLKVSGGDLQWNQELLPELTYMKQLTLQFEANFDVPMPATTTIHGVNTSLAVFLNGGAATVAE